METEGKSGERRGMGGAVFLVALLVGVPLTISGLIDLTDASGPTVGGVFRLLAGLALVGAAIAIPVLERMRR